MSADGSFAFASVPSPEELAGFPLNDLGNARRLIRTIGGSFEADGSVEIRNARLLYLRQRGWIAFNGAFWDLAAGEEIARRFAHQVAAGLIAQKACAPLETVTPKTWMDFVNKTSNAGGTSAMLAQAAVYLSVGLEAFDPDPMALNVRNGVVRFVDGKVGPEARFRLGHDPADRFTRMAEAEWRPGAPAPKLQGLLAFCQPERAMRDYLQAIFGYCATGSVKAQLFFILQGKGGDGKSTLVDAVRETLGSYAVTAGVETFLDTGVVRAADASPDVARLAGDTRLISTAEPPGGAKLASAKIKTFTGGAPITARELRQGIFEFRAAGKVVLECNSRPVITDTDDGIWRRLRIVLFEHQVPRDKVDLDLPDQLRAERDGILQWIAAGVLAWMGGALKAEPARVSAAIEDYRRGSNPFAEWVAEYVSFDPNAVELAGDLYGSFKGYCEENGYDRIMSSTAFGRQLGNLQVLGCGKNRAGKKQRKGMRLKSELERQRAREGDLASADAEVGAAGLSPGEAFVVDLDEGDDR